MNEYAKISTMSQEKETRFLGIPYDFSPPTIKLIKKLFWNKEDERIFTPKVFGWGWTINFYQLLNKSRVIK